MFSYIIPVAIDNSEFIWKHESVLSSIGGELCVQPFLFNSQDAA